MDWFTHQHPALVHLPVAAALLLPLALLAAQRGGRGMRPWWITCQYLAWAGSLGALAAVVSGFLWGRSLGIIPPGAWIPPRGAEGLQGLLRRHELFALAGFGFSALTVWACLRPRKDHQGIGVLALLLGLGWTGCHLMAGLTGGGMTHPRIPAPQAHAEPVPESTVAEPDPESDAPIRFLDYQSLEPVHTEPVKSPEHGGRWIRTWVTASGQEAFKLGKPLPPGAFVVMSTVEDRWGRPGQEPGPLFGLESLADGKSSLTLYWPRIPEARRGETGGEGRAYWRGEDAHLKACLACHAQGPSDPGQRSAWVAPRRVVPTPVVPAP